MPSPIIKKVRIPRIRPPQPTPKEKKAWQNFLSLLEEIQVDKEMSPIVKAELDRLAARGNPLAIRFLEKISIAAFTPREASVDPLPPPQPRRISRLKWGRPGKPEPGS